MCISRTFCVLFLAAFAAGCSQASTAESDASVPDLYSGDATTCTVDKDCDDGNACTSELCEGGFCTWTNTTGACDDGNACTEGDSCDEGICSGAWKECNDQDWCNGDETCNPQTGECVAGQARVEDDGVECTVEQCDEERRLVAHVPDNGFCDDFNPCTNDVCDLTIGCTNTLTPGQECDDEDLCTTEDRCSDEGVCGGTPIECGDDLWCNGDESCNPEDGQCADGIPPDVDDGLSCTMDTCSEEKDQVLHDPDDGLCEDGNQCTENTCDPVEGCVSVDLSGACDDGDACTSGDYCQEGDCKSGEFICTEDCFTEGDEDRDMLPDCADSDCHFASPCQDTAGTCEDPFLLSAVPLETANAGRTFWFQGDTAGRPSVFTGSCAVGGLSGPELFHRIELKDTLRLNIGLSFRDGATGVIYVLDSTCSVERACAVLGAGKDTAGLVLQPGVYALAADSAGAAGGIYDLSVQVAAPAAAETVCDDGIDDDGNGLTDCQDGLCAFLNICLSGETCDEAWSLFDTVLTKQFVGMVFELNQGFADPSFDTTGMSDDFRGSCSSAGTKAPDVMYRFSNSDPLRFSFKFDFQGLPYPAIHLLNGECSLIKELACAKATTAAATLQYSLPPGNWALALDGDGNGDFGVYNLVVEVKAPPAKETECQDGQDEDIDGLQDCLDDDCKGSIVCIGLPGDRCTNPFSVVSGTVITAQSFDKDLLFTGDSSIEMKNDYSAPCAAGSAGSPDQVYVFELQSPAILDFDFLFKKAGAFLYPAVYVFRGGCDSEAAFCMAGKNNAVAGRFYLPAAKWYLVVDGNYVSAEGVGDAGPYNLKLRFSLPPLTETDCLDKLDNDLDGKADCLDTDCAGNLYCKDPYEPNDTTLSSFDLGDLTGSARVFTGAALFPAGDADYFWFSVNDLVQATLKLTPQASLDLRFELLAQNGTSLKAVDAGGTGGAETLSKFELAMGHYFLKVSSYNSSTGTYSMDLSFPLKPKVETLCDNGLDDDQDLLIDCCDPDCVAAQYCAAEAVCGDQKDNDCDGKKECEDTDCAGSAYCGGGDQCVAPAPLAKGIGLGTAQIGTSIQEWGTTVGYQKDFTLSCAAGSANANDAVWRLEIAQKINVRISLDFISPTVWPAVVLGGGTCGLMSASLGCVTAMSDPAVLGPLPLTPGTYWIYADGAYAGDASDYTLKVEITAAP